MPSFHIDTFRLLRTDPQASQTAIQQLLTAEQRLGTQLPPAVREWYSIRDAEQILESHSNNDPPIPIDEFELERSDLGDIIPFRHENQGVALWSILLDGSDDPPVYVNVDDNGWNILAKTFSGYIYSCVWDYAVVLDKPAFVQAQNDPLSDGALNSLTREFEEHIRTYGWPGSTQFRFSRDRQAILIWSAENQADWFVAADDADALRSALQTVWQFDAVGQSFYDCSEIGKTVLQEFTQEA